MHVVTTNHSPHIYIGHSICPGAANTNTTALILRPSISLARLYNMSDRLCESCAIGPAAVWTRGVGGQRREDTTTTTGNGRRLN